MSVSLRISVLHMKHLLTSDSSVSEGSFAFVLDLPKAAAISSGEMSFSFIERTIDAMAGLRCLLCRASTCQIVAARLSLSLLESNEAYQCLF